MLAVGTTTSAASSAVGLVRFGISVPSLSVGLPVVSAILVVSAVTANVVVHVTLALGATGPAKPAHSALVSVTSSALFPAVPASSVMVNPLK